MQLVVVRSSAVVCCLLAAASCPIAVAWTTSTPPPSSKTSAPVQQAAAVATTTRQGFLKTAAAAAFGVATAASGGLTSSPAFAAETLDNGVTYEVVKKGDGPKPNVGELVAIRFSAYCGDVKIDDIFDTPEPYYTRLGSGGLIKGVEQALPYMKLGDRWKLTIPVSTSISTTAIPAREYCVLLVDFGRVS